MPPDMTNEAPTTSRPWKLHFIMAKFVVLFLLALTAWLSVKTWNGVREHKFIGVPIERNEITVEGEGRVVALPDVAEIDLGASVERPSVGEAQAENTRIMNGVTAKLVAEGVDAKDMQTTAYAIYPAYDYFDGRQRLRGYQVTQNVHVKIRDLTKVGGIIGAAGALGADQIGNISFAIDEPEAVKQLARVKALENAKEKAAALARVVGVKLRRVVKFEETSTAPVPGPVFGAYLKETGGAQSVPSVQPGSNEIVVNATVTYEIE